MRTLNLSILERKGVNDLLTMAEMCEVFGRSRSSIYRYMNDLGLGFPLSDASVNFHFDATRSFHLKIGKIK